MSAIGDYIHNTAYGYNVFGTNYTNTGRQSDSEKIDVFVSQFNKAKEQVLKNKDFISPQDKDKLEERLSLFSKKPSGEHKNELEKIWKILLEELQEEFQAAAEDVNQLTHDVLQGYRTDAKKIKKRKNQQYVLTSTILKRVDLLNQSIGNLGFSENYMNKIQEHMKSIQRQVKQLGILAQEVSANTNYQRIREQGKVLKKRLQLNEASLNIIDTINETINMINGSASMQKGMLQQAIVALAPVVGAKKTKTQLRKIIKSAFAENKSKVTFYGDLFSDDVALDKILSQGYEYNNNDIYTAAKASPDKVDVTIEWKGKQLPVSVKNVSFNIDNSSPYVNLVSQSSMLALLQAIGPDYTNHYLNVMSKHRYTHAKGNVKTGKYQGSYQGVTEAQVRSIYIQKAQQSIRLSLLIAAFQGYKKNAVGGQAEVFVINDNQTGRVKIYNISDLILRLLDTQAYLDHSLTKIQGNGKQVEFIRFENSFVSGRRSRENAYKRITNLLTEVHQQKITVAVSKMATFKQFI